MMISGNKIAVVDGRGSGVNVDTFESKSQIIETYLYHLSINQMKKLRLLATKLIAQKKREGYNEDEGELGVISPG